MTDVHRIRVFDYQPSPIVSTSLLEDTLIVARDSGFLEIWSVVNFSHCLCSFAAASPKDIKAVRWLTFRGEKAFAICLFSGEIVIYSYPSLEIVAQSPSFGGPIWNAAVNDEQTLLAIACDDGVVRLFETTSELQLALTSDPFTSKCMSVCFGHDGSLYAGDSSGRIERIDTEKGQFIARFDVGSQNSQVTVWSLCALPDNQLASADSNGNVIIWDTNTTTVDTRFSSHQADVLVLACHNNHLYAAGIDPTLVTFERNEDGEWIQRGQSRQHTHDVNSISVNDRHLITAGLDACIYKRGLIMPFQVPTPIASAMRDNDIIVVGGEGNQLSIWRFTGESASLELKIKTQDPVDAVAISRDGLCVAYSATNTRIIRYAPQKSQWELTDDRKAKASALCFSSDSTLYAGTLAGDIYAGDAFKTIGFPVVKLAVTNNGKYVVAAGLDRAICLRGTLHDDKEGGFPYDLPSFGVPISAITFRNNEPLLFCATSANKVTAFDVKKKNLVPYFTFVLPKGKACVAPYALSFAPDDHDKLLVSSSQDTYVLNMNRVVETFTLPYSDYLYCSFVSEKRIVVYEKPWAFMMHTLPMPFRIKRFQGTDDTRRPRY